MASLSKMRRGPGDRRSAASRLAAEHAAAPSLLPALRSRLRASAVVALALLAAVFWVASGSKQALGSCAVQSLESPDAFTGVVVSTRSHDRVATVLTDAGARVLVWGTPDIGSAVTSVDRTYEVGGRYEFHPTNSASPYQDNACTATHLLESDFRAAFDALRIYRRTERSARSRSHRRRPCRAGGRLRGHHRAHRTSHSATNPRMTQTNKWAITSAATGHGGLSAL